MKIVLGKTVYVLTWVDAVLLVGVLVFLAKTAIHYW